MGRTATADEQIVLELHRQKGVLGPYQYLRDQGQLETMPSCACTLGKWRSGPLVPHPKGRQMPGYSAYMISLCGTCGLILDLRDKYHARRY
jgi:hypothetical protein